MATRLYVGNLSYETQEARLREFFEQDGRTVTDVHIVTDRDTGRSRGFAFVELGDGAELATVIAALDGRELDGRRLSVSEARPRRPRESGPPRGNGGREVPTTRRPSRRPHEGAPPRHDGGGGPRRDDGAGGRRSSWSGPPPWEAGPEPVDALGDEEGRRRAKKKKKKKKKGNRRDRSWDDDGYGGGGGSSGGGGGGEDW